MSEKRANTKERILVKAYEVLLQTGLIESSMEEIAKASDCTRRTLYRYFPSKDQLVFEVVIRILEDWNQVQHSIYNQLSGTGFQRLDDYLKALVSYMEDRMDTMRFLGTFDYYTQDRSDLQCSGEVVMRFNEVSHSSHQYLQQLIEQGSADRSLTYAGDLEVLVSTISQVLWSFGQRIAMRGVQIEAEDHVDKMKLIHCQIDLYLLALKVPEGGIQ